MIQVNEQSFLFCGHQPSESGHFFGPCRRSKYVLHYIIRGKGRFDCGGSSYSLSAGQSFLIRPMAETYLCADEEEPWEYMWIDFSGPEFIPLVSRLRFAAGDCVLESIPQERILPYFKLLRAWYAQPEAPRSGWQTSVGLALTILGVYVDACTALSGPAGHVYRCSPQREQLRHAEYFNEARRLIRESFYRPEFNLEALCEMLNISRVTLHRCFKAAGALPPGQYLLQYRLNEAKAHLDSGLTIKTAALSCGFEDTPRFSRAFRRAEGISPREYVRRRERDDRQPGETGF